MTNPLRFLRNKSDGEKLFPTRFRVAVLLLIVIALIATNHTVFDWLTQEKVKHIETVSLCLEILATVLGGLALFDFAHTLKRLEDIMNSLSTRREQLPTSLKSILRMLQSDGIEMVRIMVDFADYGQYADSKWNADYVSELKKLVEDNATIRYLSYSRSFGRKELDRRFKYAHFEETKVYKDKWLKNKHINLPPGTPIGPFIERLLDNEEKWINQLKGNNFHFRQCNSTLPVLCWIVGKKGATTQDQAVVYFPLHSVHGDFGPDAHRLRGEGISFLTTDPHLIDGFTKAFDKLYEENDPERISAPLHEPKTGPGFYS